MTWIIFIVSAIIGGCFGYCFAKINKLERDNEELRTRQNVDWYDLTMGIADKGNKIQTIEDFLHIKFPDMEETIFAKYANLNKEKEVE